MDFLKYYLTVALDGIEDHECERDHSVDTLGALVGFEGRSGDNCREQQIGEDIHDKLGHGGAVVLQNGLQKDPSLALLLIFNLSPVLVVKVYVQSGHALGYI